MFKPTGEQIRIMKHALGLDREATAYRNHYCAAPGHLSWPDLMILEEEKFLLRVTHPPKEGEMETFMVTNEGKPWCKRAMRVT